LWLDPNQIYSRDKQLRVCLFVERVLKIAFLCSPESSTLLAGVACDVETTQKEPTALALTNSSITDFCPKKHNFCATASIVEL
jgi:hypothetical protein